MKSLMASNSFEGSWWANFPGNKSTFGSVTPFASLDQYTIGKLNTVSWSGNGQMTLKVKVNNPYFQYQPKVSKDACLVQIWWFQRKFREHVQI